MNRDKLSIKKIRKFILSINNLIENYFNSLRILKSDFKKGKLIRNNRVFLSFGAIIILTLSYFLLPTIYNKSIIQSQIKNHILKKYNITLKFNEQIKYGLIPKPHFSSKNLSIIGKQNEIGTVENLKIFIDITKFFSLDQINIKDLVFKKTDFNIKISDLMFFKKLLTTEPNENKIVFKDSNLFFRSNDDEILFLNKIYDSKFYYDSYNLENVLVAKNELFNAPYKLVIKNNKFNKDVSTRFKSQKIRLNIENNINYEDQIKKGLLDILFINKSTSLEYSIKKNSLIFSTDDKKILNGSMNFKPFYLQLDLNYEGLSTKNLFDDETILMDLIKSEIIKNENLNVNIGLNVKNITNSNELSNLNLNIGLEQGDIVFSKSKILWRDNVEIELNEGLLDYNNDEIFLSGKLTVNADDIGDFYKSFQIKKNDRKQIKKIQFDFVYGFNKRKFKFDNVKVDNKSDEKIDQFINNYNSSEKVFLNKITFKNFINNFFKVYSG